MKKKLFLLLIMCYGTMINAQDKFETSGGELTIHFVGHGSLYFQYQGKTIHIDPWSKLADYTQLPKADYILITHEHGDHLDTNAIEQIIQPETQLICAPVCKEALTSFTHVVYMNNGDSYEATWGLLQAVPAYNMMHMRAQGQPYHPKGTGNGYVLTFSDKKVYVAGDTENIPEMKTLENIDIAFLPMNLPYTMTPKMVADAVEMFQPKILYPYHFGDTDTHEVEKLLRQSKTEVRIRSLK